MQNGIFHTMIPLHYNGNVDLAIIHSWQGLSGFAMVHFISSLPPPLVHEHFWLHPLRLVLLEPLFTYVTPIVPCLCPFPLITTIVVSHGGKLEQHIKKNVSNSHGPSGLLDEQYYISVVHRNVVSVSHMAQHITKGYSFKSGTTEDPKRLSQIVGVFILTKLLSNKLNPLPPLPLVNWTSL